MFTYKTELQLHNHILNNFNSYFPYTLIANEYELKKGRVDFLAEDEDNLYVIELKKDFVNKSTIQQLDGYMKLIKDEYKNKNVIGIAIAPQHKDHLNDIEIPDYIELRTIDDVDYVGIIRTAIILEKDLKKNLKIVAKEQNRSLNNLIETIMKEYLAKK